MKLSILLLITACTHSIAAEPPPLMMPAVRVSAADISLDADVVKNDAIDKITVIAVRPGSTAAEVGIRVGDRIVADDGGPLVGRKIGTIHGPDGFTFHGKVTFEGHRGLLRKKWSATVEVETLVKKKKPNQAPEPTAPSGRGSP
jgi:hypothetical protein